VNRRNPLQINATHNKYPWESINLGSMIHGINVIGTNDPRMKPSRMKAPWDESTVYQLFIKHLPIISAIVSPLVGNVRKSSNINCTSDISVLVYEWFYLNGAAASSPLKSNTLGYMIYMSTDSLSTLLVISSNNG